MSRRWTAWLIALAAVGTMPPMEHSHPFDAWYGNWRDAFLVSGVFVAFVLGFVWPRGGMQWRNAGVYSAFVISLFVEMFGIPLTIYAVAPLLDLRAFDFGMNESHLWAYALDRAGLVPLYGGVRLVMIASMAFVALGMALVAVGWAQVFGARYTLRTTGLYRLVRHPQYLGLILVVVALMVQWPTVPTLAMAPLLILMYVRQARRADRELESRFGGEYAAYAVRVPAFVPRPPVLRG